MSQPGIVQTELGDESVLTRVDFGGDDALYVTPTRLVVYRGEGLLSDESVETYPHGAERITLSEGRRKSKLTLDYGLDGERTLALPTSALDETLHPVLAGTLEASGRLDDDESVERTFRFSELTLVVTSARLVKHVGAAVWDTDLEEFPFADVTDLTFEEGSVATSVVLTMGDRQERFKAPNDQARLVRESIRAALLTYHDATSVEELRAAAAERRADEADGDEEDPRPNTLDLGDGPEPLSANPRELSDDRLDRLQEDATDATETGASGAGGGDAGAGGNRSDPNSTGGADTADTARGGAAAAENAASGAASSGADTGAGSDGAAAAGESGAMGAGGEPADGDGSAPTAGADAGAGSRSPPGEADDATGSGSEDGEDPAGGFEPPAVQPADGEPSVPAEVAAELRELRETVEAQGERIESQADRIDRQADLVETLIEELRQGR